MEHDCTQQDKINKFCKFQGSTEEAIKNICGDVKDINKKINALLFTVLGSVFVGVIVIAVRFSVKALTS